MLFVVFQVAGDRYAIDAAQVVEVLPLVQIKQIPTAPRGVAGVINYRGSPVPVVDVCAAMLGRPAQRQLSTRLIILRCAGATSRAIALLAEHATETRRIDEDRFLATGVATTDARYLGPVATDETGRLLQRVDAEKLLPDHVREALFETLSTSE